MFFGIGPFLSTVPKMTKFITLPETFLCPNMESDIVLESLGPTAWRDGLGFLDFGKILELARFLEHTITGKLRQNVKLAIMIRISC